MDLPNGFDAVIEALTIFKRHDNPTFPFHCEHDVLHVMVEQEKVPEEDRVRLSELGFEPSDETGSFMSFRYGSA